MKRPRKKTSAVFNPAPWAVEPSIILANLTDCEFDKFHAARVSYTGSTGKGGIYDCAKTGYGDVGPYIATYGRHLVQALDALGWRTIRVDRQEGQWIVRHERRQR